MSGSKVGGRLDGWGLYLTLVVCLLPVINPAGPGRTAIVDAVILVGLGAFAASIMMRPERVQIPFFAPVILMSVGSIAAIVNAVSPQASYVAIAGDAYLFLWFIMLVHILQRRDLTGLRMTWVVVANVVAFWGLFILMTQANVSFMDMLKPRGRRAMATFYDPNMLGGYLVMSMFILLSLGPKISRWMRWGSLALMSMTLIATKSNGAMLSLVFGLVAWAMVRARTRRISPAAIMAGGLLVLTVAITAVWLNAALGVGKRTLDALEQESILARTTRSTESRLAVWKQLQNTYARSPLGIGPGNSRHQSLSIENRLRPASMASREAHNDYLAYAIERGPLALIGLLMLVFQAIGKVAAASGRGDRKRIHGDAIGPLAAGMAGALAACLVHALTVEVLHFRHFWMLLAIICSIQGVAAAERKASELADGTPFPTAGDRMAVA